MKLKPETTSRTRLTRPRVRLSETEILADLNYPTPAVTDEKDGGRDRSGDDSR